MGFRVAPLIFKQTLRLWAMYLVSERKPGNFVEYKAEGNFNHWHILNIPRIKIYDQRNNRQNLRFLGRIKHLGEICHRKTDNILK